MPLLDAQVLALIRSFWADKGLPPTPSAEAMKAYLDGPGRRQVGSRFDPLSGVIWMRPLKGGRWYADRASN